MNHDPNQRIVIAILGIAFLVGIGSLCWASIIGSPIDVSVFGLVSAIGGCFTNYLKSTPPPPPPGSVQETKTITPPVTPTP